MPKDNTFLFVSTNFDNATEATDRALRRLYDEYQDKKLMAYGIFPCWRDTLEDFINQYDQKTIYIASHGNEYTITAQDGSPMLDESNIEIMSGRCLYVWSCSTGKVLIPKAIEKKCLVAIAYDTDVSAFIHQNPDGTWDLDEDSYDVFSKPIKTLSEAGKTFKDAYDETIARYDYWINYYKDQPAIKAVFEENKAGLKLYGDGSQVALLTPLQETQKIIQESASSFIGQITSFIMLFLIITLIKSIITIK